MVLTSKLNQAVIETELEIGKIFTIKSLGRAVYMGKLHKGEFYTGKGYHSFCLVTWKGGSVCTMTKKDIAKGMVIHSY